MLESVAVVDKQPVVPHFLFVEDGVPDAEVLVRHVVGLVTDNDLYAGRARAQRADRQPAVVRMCPENLVRVVVRTADEKCEVPVADGRRLQLRLRRLAWRCLVLRGVLGHHFTSRSIEPSGIGSHVGRFRAS